MSLELQRITRRVFWTLLAFTAVCVIVLAALGHLREGWPLAAGILVAIAWWSALAHTVGHLDVQAPAKAHL
ncbi:MAG: hypothetical protein IMW91_06335, partial [Firmicutes bacterium]|nr:hypothetical protein [Bacillota bacterium]